MAHRITRSRNNAEVQQERNCASITELPEALLVGIFNFLAPQECSRAATVSCHWRNVADRHICWSRFHASKWPCMKDVAARAAEVDPRMTAKSLFIKMHQRTKDSHRRTHAGERGRLHAHLQHVSLLVELFCAETGDVFWSTAVSVVDVRAMREVMKDGLYVPLPPGLALGVARKYASVRVSFIDPHAARISAPVVYPDYECRDESGTVTINGRTWECLYAGLCDASHDGQDSYLDFDVEVETLCVVRASEQQMIRGAADLDDDEVCNVVPEEVQLRVRLPAVGKVNVFGEFDREADADDLDWVDDMPLKMLRVMMNMMHEVGKWY